MNKQIIKSLDSVLGRVETIQHQMAETCSEKIESNRRCRESVAKAKNALLEAIRIAESS